MKVQFTNPAAQESFDEKGYAILDFLTEDELNDLKQLAKTYIPDIFQGIFTNVHLLDPEPNKIIGDSILRILEPRLEEVLPDYVLPMATFIVKSAEPDNTSFSLHQDPNTVDEKEFTSLGLWVPLLDTEIKNGGLCVLPGSHEIRYTVRCIQLPSLVIDFDDGVEPYVEYLNVKAGQCCIFSHQLFHGSPPNKSGALRPIIHGGVIPRMAQLIYHFIDNEGQMSVLKTKENFSYTDLRSVMQGVVPSHIPILEVLDQYPPQLTKEEVLSKVKEKRGSNKKEIVAGAAGFMAKLLSHFKY